MGRSDSNKRRRLFAWLALTPVLYHHVTNRDRVTRVLSTHDIRTAGKHKEQQYHFVTWEVLCSLPFPQIQARVDPYGMGT